MRLNLREGDECCVLIRQEGNHVRVLELLGLLRDPECLFQMSAHVLESIVASKGFFEGARSKCGECGGVGFDAGANEKGLRVEPLIFLTSSAGLE